MSCHAQSLPVRLHASRLQARYILGVTDASHKLIQTLLEGTKPLSKNFDLDKQPVLPALHQICQTRHRGHSTLRIENLSTFDDGRDDSLGHHGIPCREDLRIIFWPRGIERSKDSWLTCGGRDSVQNGVDADARAAV